nr:MAG TPA: hypothetical protein [Caudoviricetes sp.]DAI16255.1 MAG TPA: hypothetical protein [Caudoviricetes sp.]DAN09875.1 MAG TPA: hypothetical protein [Caudoviricetes sp.]DAR74159.1 MAG TPA: hypothetical protein [Caudoviricetes sp.]DAT67407.1 MAG TPA: hypothetical protein [Caudoviricetes sp.]
MRVRHTLAHRHNGDNPTLELCHTDKGLRLFDAILK